MNIFLNYIRDNWNAISGEEITPENINFMKLSGQVSETAPANFILFVNKKPAYFIKVDKSDASSGRVRREFENLQRIRAILPREMVETTPEPVFIGKLDDFANILLEKFLVGEKIELANRHGLKKLFEDSFRWLENFYSCTKRPGQKFDITRIAQKVDRLKSSYEFDIEFTNKIDALIVRAGNFNGKTIPSCASQGDFDFDNILVANNNIAVLDWEDFRENHHPFFDAEFFIFNLSLNFYKGIGDIDSFNKFFALGSETYKMSNFYINEYCNFFGLKRSFFYLSSFIDTVDLILDGHGGHHLVSMQSINFLKGIIDLSLREMELGDERN